jgi:protein-disulfide isomerase
MNVSEVPRVAAPLLLAAAIVLSFPPEPPPQPIELPAGEAPMPSPAETRGALAQALAPGAPGFDRGPRRAEVTVLEFADFGCRYCARFSLATYPALAAEFVRTGRVRWKSVPFALGMFPNGGAAARAADCAGAQGPAAFDRIHDRLFARQDEWQHVADPDSLFRSYAGAVGLDVTGYAACTASDAAAEHLHAANDLADRLGVRATPTFFINGTRIEGALPVEQFRGVLRDAMRGSDGH